MFLISDLQGKPKTYFAHFSGGIFQIKTLTIVVKNNETNDKLAFLMYKKRVSFRPQS